MRVLTWNIHKCIGGVDRRYRPERIIDAIAKHAPDVALLQEVDEGVKRSKGDRQVDILGDALGYRHRTFFPNVKVRGGGHYGNAILSRYPIRETRNINVTIPPMKRRSVLHAKVRVRKRTIQVYNLHLGLSQLLRKKQLDIFLKSYPFRKYHSTTPVLVAGDFNDVWGTLGTKMLVPRGFRAMPKPLRTFPAVAPMRALDSIYLRGRLHFESIERPMNRQASDHLPLVAKLTFK